MRTTLLGQSRRAEHGSSHTRTVFSLALSGLGALTACAATRPQPATPCVATAAPAPTAASATALSTAGETAPPIEADPEFLSDWTATLRYTLGTPQSITLAPDGSAVFFLRSGPRSFVRDLYVLDANAAQPRVLVTADAILRGAEEQLSAEERARRERMRQAGRGISSYKLSPDGTTLLVPLSGKLYLVDRQSGAARELASQQQGAAVDPRFSPDGRYVSCVRGGELVVTEVRTGRERRLTTPAGAGITHATAEFVAQEEMDRMDGYWWSPDARFLAYQETDERAVEQLHISDPTHPEAEPESNRYPRAGRTNATVKLGVVPVGGGRTTWIEWDRARYPYLANVVWSRNAPLTVVVQNRAQTEVLVLAADPQTGRTRTLHTETDAAWVNLDAKVPHWLEDGSAFLWSSDRSGESVLELRRADGQLDHVVVTAGVGYRSLLHVDEAAGFVYVTGGPESAETQVFRAPIRPGHAAPEQLTREPGEHDMVFAQQGGARVHTALLLNAPRAWTFERADGTRVAELPSVAEEPRVAPRVELLTVGEAQWRAAIVRPRSFDPSRRYPVIDAVYGGPGARQVTSARLRYAMSQWLADHGFVVVSLDGRGTPFRGRAWERALRGRLGDVPLDEQVNGLRALGERFHELDLSRVGVYGWSFGGYLSALAVLRRPDVFHAAVAGAPVTDWRDYDTHYTERFLGLPDAERAAYDQSSLVVHAGELTRPLLLVHGTADDNVYFTHAARLSDALFRAGRPHEFLPLVGFTHMVPDPNVNRRLNEGIASFLRRNLYGASAAPGPASPAR